MSTSGNPSTSQPPGTTGSHNGSHPRRQGGDLAGEHALTDIGQLVLLAVFLGVWITDSFVFHYTTSWTLSLIRVASPALLLAARLVLSAAVLVAAGVLAHRSYAAVQTLRHRVSSYEIGAEGTVRPDVLLDLMLDGAWRHVHSTDFSYTALLARDRFWVASRFTIVFDRIPTWEERIVLSTWGKGVQRFTALRDFIIHSETGDRLAAATSSWMIIDRGSYRPVKLDDLEAGFPMHPERHALEDKPRKIPSCGAARERARITVRHSDLDVNRHVTASRYMRWTLDGFSEDLLDHRRIRSFEINFMAEALLGDEVTVLIGSDGEGGGPVDDGAVLCAVRRKSDDSELCRARVKWGEPAAAG